MFFTVNTDRLQILLRPPIEPTHEYRFRNEQVESMDIFLKCSSAKCISTVDIFPGPCSEEIDHWVEVPKRQTLSLPVKKLPGRQNVELGPSLSQEARPAAQALPRGWRTIRHACACAHWGPGASALLGPF